MELTTFDSMMLIFISIIGLLLAVIPSVVWNKSIQGKTLDFELIRKRKYYKLLSGFGAIMFLAASLELFPMEEGLSYVFVELSTKFGASPPSLTAENPVVISEHHHPKMLKTL